MTQNEYKAGDKVMFKGDGNLHVISDINEEGLYKVSGSCGWFGARYLEPYDRKTAFLTRLQSLLREFDARIYDDECKCIIDLGIHGDKSERIKYTDFDWELNADNIMDFEKE